MMHVRIKSNQLEMTRMELKGIRDTVHNLQLKVKEEKDLSEAKNEQLSRMTANVDERKLRYSRISGNMTKSITRGRMTNSDIE